MKSSEFTSEQRHEMELGLAEGLNVLVYAKKEYLAIQMREIRLGMEDGLQVEYYASPQYDWLQMAEIREGLVAHIDVAKYANPSIAFDVMRQIRLGLEEGIDLSMGTAFSAGVLKELRLAMEDGLDIRKYIQVGYQEKQLEEIRLALRKGLDIDPYLRLVFRGASIHEIAAGLEQGLDVSVYADERMNWQQMRELRLGLEARIPVRQYKNHWFSWQQMQEIRLGLQDDLDVTPYARLMYTSREMKRIRLELLKRQRTEQMRPKRDIQILDITSTEEPKKEYEDFAVVLPEDEMSASIFVAEIGTKISRQVLLQALMEHGVISGLKQDVIERLEREGADAPIILVAEGTEPQPGNDAWYEFFFDREQKKSPKILEDGSVDYQNVKWFEMVYKGAMVARYHEASAGAYGMKVTGEMIPGRKGQQLPPLRGRGFTLLEDQITYEAALDGKIDYSDGVLEITNVLVLENVTRADPYVDFDGSVCVNGFVGDGARIHAAKDILVNGYTEGAELEAGGDIILKRGNNAGGRGSITAGGSVFGTFFELARVRAGGDIKANYCLNSDIDAEGTIEITGKYGVLAGGRASAAQQILSYDIGNEAELATQIFVGREILYATQKKNLDERAASVEKELSLLRGALKDFQMKYSAQDRNNNPMYLKIEAAIHTKKGEMKEILAMNDNLDYKIKMDHTAKVVVTGSVYRGVRIEINRAVWNAQKTNNATFIKRKGAVAVYRNR